MRNPFKTVYCKDCEFMIGGTNANLDYAKCQKSSSRALNVGLRRVGKKSVKLNYCQFIRFFPWCFRYKEAKNV